MNYKDEGGHRTMNHFETIFKNGKEIKANMNYP